MKKIVNSVFFIFFSSILIGQSIYDIEADYNKAFYKNDYKRAFEIISLLISQTALKPDYFREQAKMAAIIGKHKEMLVALENLKRLNLPESKKMIDEVVSWKNLPKDSLEICKKNGFNIQKDVINFKNKEQNENLVKFDLSNTKQTSDNLKPICYISETGKRYHADPYCSRGLLYPAYDLEIVKRNGLSPCQKCWKGKSLY